MKGLEYVRRCCCTEDTGWPEPSHCRWHRCERCSHERDTQARLAWRNIWRNRRRTLITAASVFVAVFLALAMRSMQIGSYDKMISDVVEQYTGYVQVHATGYWDDQTIENIFALDSTLIERLAASEHVTGIVPRLESFALASSGPRTRGAQVVGTDPEADDSLTALRGRLTKGTFIRSGDSSALLAGGLATYLGLAVGDTLVLLSQGYRGAGAAGAYPVAGIVELASPELNKRMVYLPLSTAQGFYAAENMVTSVALDLTDADQTGVVASRLRTVLDTTMYEIMTWRQMLTELVQQIQTDNAGGLIMIGILYLIIAFGIFETANSAFDETMVFVRREGLVELAGIPDGDVHEVAVLLDERDRTRAAADTLSALLPSLAVRSWRESQPMLAALDGLVGTMNMLFIVIILLALAFGIVNTMLMAVLERTKELGMLRAVGMSTSRLFTMILLETVMLALVGGVLGSGLAAGAIAWFGHTGIDLSRFAEGLTDIGYDPVVRPSIEPDFFLVLSLLIVLTGVLSALYPARKALALRPSEALRTE